MITVNLDQDYPVSTWSRTTVADGKWLNINTIEPLINRDNKLLSLINDVDNTVTTLETDFVTEKTTRSEADSQLNSELMDLSELINNEIEVEAGSGISINTTEDGTLKFSVSFNPEDNTKYSELVMSDNQEAAIPGSGDWTFEYESGSLLPSQDKKSITGLTPNLMYHVTCIVEYTNETSMQYITTAGLYIDGKTKPVCEFPVDLSIPAAIPLTLSFDYVALSESFKIKNWNWNLENLSANEITPSTKLKIKKLSIHEVAPYIIAQNTSDAQNNIKINHYHVCNCSDVRCNKENWVGLKFDGECKAKYQINTDSSQTIAHLNSDALYKCDATISFYIDPNVSLDGKKYEIVSVRYPHSAEGSELHKEVATAFINYEIDEYKKPEDTKIDNGTPITLTLGWQMHGCDTLSIEINGTSNVYAKLNYLHMLEI